MIPSDKIAENLEILTFIKSQKAETFSNNAYYDYLMDRVKSNEQWIENEYKRVSGNKIDCLSGNYTAHITSVSVRRIYSILGFKFKLPVNLAGGIFNPKTGWGDKAEWEIK